MANSRGITTRERHVNAEHSIYGRMVVDLQLNCPLILSLLTGCVMCRILSRKFDRLNLKGWSSSMSSAKEIVS